jgi:hypothetical protein
MSEYKSGQIIKEEKLITCCLHKNIIPMEYTFSKKTWPNGYKSDPDYAATNILSADTMRVRTYICLDCKCEIKAPNPGQWKKNIL